ncbi:MAG: choice-of-anchor Q domain-containing protein, partial [Kiritimatiellae bacterium]|nr:choice-of-anchor Q domain-containing protein [Kiritimatiellia bacterium]
MLLLGVVLCLFGGPGKASADVVGEMGFVQIEPVAFSLDYEDYRSSTSRLWYAHFQADDAYETKPLFVLLNGGPGCGTCMNLFSMNTAPYTLDRNRMATNDPYGTNSYSWTALGNLLYIDAPNTGYSYTLDADPFSWHSTHIWEFIGGDNYNAFIDAAQVLRAILQFLDAHPTLKTNEVIMVGESYSGVRVSTLLNLLLYHNTYAAGSRTYKDPGLITAITNHFKTVLGKEPPFTPEEVATQFGRQILIQPQIVDKYQGTDMYASFEQPGSTRERLGYEARATTNWPDYLNNNYGGKCSYDAVSGYLSLINRDAYNALESADWTDLNENFSMKRLNSCAAMETITGGYNPTNIPYMAPAARSNAVKFMMGQSVFDNATLKWLVNKYASAATIAMLESMAPGWKTGRQDMEYDPDYLVYKLGELNDIDAYVTGTNPYIFLGFLVNGGGDNLVEVAYNWYFDPFDISPGDSDRYGRMFLENLAIVDTFMTDAKYDYVVYAPTLPSQFAGNRFTNCVEQITTCQGDDSRRYGSFTVDYKENAIGELQQSPEYRTVSWRHYGEAGHAVSASQPGEFREDVASWMNNNWYNVYPREGSVTGSTEVTVYGEDLCVDSNDLQYVTVGGLTATVVSASSGRITFVTPALPQGAGDVVLVSVEYGTTTISNGFCAKLPQTITVLSPAESTCFGVSELISCTATSSVAGMEVTFAVDTTDPVDGLTNGATGFSMPAVGTATIRFEQAGDDNWFAAETVIRHVAVTSDTPKVYYVTTDGDNANHGLTWSQAKRTPQGAADQAASGDIILVSNGVYNISESVHYGTNRVVLSEGVTMRSVNGPEVTVIDGGGQKRGVYMKADTTLEGFTIQNGSLGGAPTNWPERAGAGIFASQRAVIDNCIIQSNTINISDVYYAIGGGVCMDSDVTMSHCRVLDNSVATVGNNSFGGGLTVIEDATNCLIDNTVIAGNHTLYYAGGILLGLNSQSTFLNCTITENSAPDTGSGIYASHSYAAMNNSIIYGNTGASDMSFYESTIWFTNSCVPSTSSGHFVNSITNDPQLQSLPRGMIGANSPCRDAGANTLTNSTTDLAARPRVINNVVDIGAYEFQSWILTDTNGTLLLPDMSPDASHGTDFGAVHYGVALTNEIILQNVSTGSVSVNIVLRGDGFDAFALGVPSQLTLSPGSVTNIAFIFLANSAGTSAVELCFTDFDLTSFVQLRGETKEKSTLSTPQNLSFECTYNYLDPDPQTFALSNAGPSDCAWHVEKSADWMHMLPENADLPSTNAFTNLVAYVIPGELPAGTYTSTNRFISPSANTVTQIVTLTVTR